MPYLCGFADSMLQKVSKKVSKQKGGALELYSSKTRPDKYVVKNNDFTTNIVGKKKGSRSF